MERRSVVELEIARIGRADPDEPLVVRRGDGEAVQRALGRASPVDGDDLVGPRADPVRGEPHPPSEAAGRQVPVAALPHLVEELLRVERRLGEPPPVGIGEHGVDRDARARRDATWRPLVVGPLHGGRRRSRDLKGDLQLGESRNGWGRRGGDGRNLKRGRLADGQPTQEGREKGALRAVLRGVCALTPALEPAPGFGPAAGYWVRLR